jgi:hypothetical protein
VKWQVLIGTRLRQWRLTVPVPGTVPPETRKLKQAHAGPAIGIKQDELSELERGHRRVDAVELRRLMVLYGREPAKLEELFVPPTDDEWKEIRSVRDPDERYWDPPTRDSGVRLD